jgi:hypothetical protein
MTLLLQILNAAEPRFVQFPILSHPRTAEIMTFFAANKDIPRRLSGP